jgi:N-methylhydantoinase A
MYRETSRLFSQVGEEPSGYALLAFGGAGPMLGCLLADAMGMQSVIIPQTPGVLAALGGLLADLRSDFVRVVFLDVGPSSADGLRRAMDDLTKEARAWLIEGQGYAGEAALSITADMRYRGQSYEIETPLEQSWVVDGDHGAIAAAFHKRHAEIYDHSDDAADVQIVAIRVVIAGVTPKPHFAEQRVTQQQVQPRKLIPIAHQGSIVEAGLFDRNDLSPGSSFAGPAVILQDDTTTWAPPGFEGHVDGFGNLILKRSAI